MATKFCANAIEWKLKQLGLWEAPSICTRETEAGSGEFNITKWEKVDMEQPDDDTINEWIAEFEEAQKEEDAEDDK
jgi:hypothetical protein